MSCTPYNSFHSLKKLYYQIPSLQKYILSDPNEHFIFQLPPSALRKIIELEYEYLINTTSYLFEKVKKVVLGLPIMFLFKHSILYYLFLNRMNLIFVKNIGKN